MTYKVALLSYLPRMVAEQAINNRIREYGNGSENERVPALNMALSEAFLWDNSPERRRYWETVNTEFLKNLEEE